MVYPKLGYCTMHAFLSLKLYQMRLKRVKFQGKMPLALDPLHYHMLCLWIESDAPCPTKFREVCEGSDLTPQVFKDQQM